MKHKYFICYEVYTKTDIEHCICATCYEIDRDRDDVSVWEYVREEYARDSDLIVPECADCGESVIPNNAD